MPQTSQSGSAFGGGRTAAGEDGADVSEGEIGEGEVKPGVVAPVGVVIPPLSFAMLGIGVLMI